MHSPDLLTFLLNALWQVPLAAAIAMLACRLLGDGPASHKHAVWVAALLAAVLLPVASLRPRAPSPPLQVDLAYAVPTASTALPAAPAIPVPAPESRVVPFPYRAATLLWGAYLAFLTWCILRFAWIWRRTVRIRRAAAIPVLPPAVDSVWRHCLDVFALRGVELRSSPQISSPVTAGAWRKTIILPDALLAETSTDVLSTAIGHEMAHIARHDFPLNLLYELLLLPISFHPAAWILRRSIARTREMACDELVTDKLLDADVYAESMLAIAATMTSLPHPAGMLGVFDGDILEERIRRLLSRRTASLKRARLLFVAGLSGLAACAILASGLALTARAQTETQTELKLGADAYNREDFKSAAAHFGNAVRLDSTTVKPKLFLANTLMREFFAAGAPHDSPLMTDARRQYQDILASDPRNVQALEGMVATDLTLHDLADASQWAAKLLQADGGNKTAYYTAGVLDWAMVFQEFQRARAAAGAKPDDAFISDPATRLQLRQQFGARIDDGLAMLETALGLDPQYADAMAYMNLLDRLKSGLADTPAESAVWMAKADEWVDKAIAARRAHPPSSNRGASHIDVDGPPPGPAGAQLVAAPPPPPPPAPPMRKTEARMAVASPPPAGTLGPQKGQGWQVMGAEGMRAADLFRELHDKGFPAFVYDSATDHQVRVIAGPYLDPQSLEQAKSALTAAGFRVERLW
jgi:beta-lactamase regulating signal transducer with metallopeptidase domain/cell division septation protein DedD